MKITSQKDHICCFEMLCVSNDYLRMFDRRHCRTYPSGFCHSKWKIYVPYLLISPNNDKHFIEFENLLDKDLLQIYKISLKKYLLLREDNIFQKAYYLDKNLNFKKLCQFFCSKEERYWRSRDCECDLTY